MLEFDNPILLRGVTIRSLMYNTIDEGKNVYNHHCIVGEHYQCEWPEFLYETKCAHMHKNAEKRKYTDSLISSSTTM